MFKEWLQRQTTRNRFTEEDLMNYLAESAKTPTFSFPETRTAICTTINTNTGVNLATDIRMTRLAKAIAKEKPKGPKYDDMWDLDIILEWMKHDREDSRTNINLRTRANVLTRISVTGWNGDVTNIHRPSMVWTKETVKFRFFKWKGQATELCLYSRWMIIQVPIVLASSRLAKRRRSYVTSSLPFN